MMRVDLPLALGPLSSALSDGAYIFTVHWVEVQSGESVYCTRSPTALDGDLKTSPSSLGASPAGQG